MSGCLNCSCVESGRQRTSDEADDPGGIVVFVLPWTTRPTGFSANQPQFCWNSVEHIAAATLQFVRSWARISGIVSTGCAHELQLGIFRDLNSLQTFGAKDRLRSGMRTALCTTARVPVGCGESTRASR